MIDFTAHYERRFLLILTSLFLFLLFWDMPGARLFDPDEARYAEIPREMIASENYLRMNLNGSSYYEKPPLLYWANALSMELFGETPFAARLPVRLATAGVVCLFWIFLRAGEAPLTGLWAGLFYLSSLLPFALGRINLTDGLVNFFLTWTFFSLRTFLNPPEGGKRNVLNEVALGVGVACAMLSKGLIAVVLPGLVLIIWTVLRRSWNPLIKVFLSWAPTTFVLITVPIFLLLERANPGFLHFFIIREHFQRFSSDIHERTQPLFYFLPIFLVGLFPWTVFFFKALRVKSDQLFFCLWCFVPLIFFSLSHSKLIPYILPVFPAASVLLSRWLNSQDEQPKTKRDVWLINGFLFSLIPIVGVVVGSRARVVVELGLMKFIYMVAVLMFIGAWGAYAFSKQNKRVATLILSTAWAGIYFVLIMVVPHLTHDYSDYDLAATAASMKEVTVVSYKTYSQSFPWVLKRPIPVVSFRGELASSGIHPREIFWREEEFRKRWDSDERLLCVLPVHLRQHATDDDWLNTTRVYEIAKNHRSLLIANFNSSE